MKFNHDLFWHRLTARRKELGISERALSLAVTRQEGYIRDIKRRGSRPRIDNIQKMAAALRCTVDYLLGESDVPGSGKTVLLSDDNRALLEEFIIAALDYQGHLPPPVVAELAVGAFLHHGDGYRPEDLRKTLTLHSLSERGGATPQK